MLFFQGSYSNHNPAPFWQSETGPGSALKKCVNTFAMCMNSKPTMLQYFKPTWIEFYCWFHIRFIFGPSGSLQPDRKVDFYLVSSWSQMISFVLKNSFLWTSTGYYSWKVNKTPYFWKKLDWKITSIPSSAGSLARKNVNQNKTGWIIELEHCKTPVSSRSPSLLMQIYSC
jgi:hypothetical protein